MIQKKLGRKFLLMVATLLSFWVTLPQASVPLGAPRKAPNGKTDMYGCMQSNEYYIVNFAAYQYDPAQSAGTRSIPTPECVELPKTGPTQVTVDLLDRDVRKKHVALKILRDDGQLIAETPYLEAKQGVLSIPVDFRAPGKYEAVLFVQDSDLKIKPELGALHIGLSVAMLPDKPAPESGLAGFFVVLVGIIIGAGVMVPRWLKSEPVA